MASFPYKLPGLLGPSGKRAAGKSARDFFRRGDESRDRKLWAEAAELYQHGLALNPEAFAIWVQLGHMLKEAGSPDRAEAAYLRALKLQPDDADLHVQLGHLYSKRGEKAKARDHYALATKAGARDEHALRFLAISPTMVSGELVEDGTARSLFRRGDQSRDRRLWTEAADFYHRGLLLEPEAFDMWVQFGHMLKEVGSANRAEAAYLRGLNLRPNDPDLHVQLGHLYSSGGNAAKAHDHYARAISLGSRDRHALSFLSQSHEQDKVLRETLARLIPDQQRKWNVLNSNEAVSSFANFILRHAV